MAEDTMVGQEDDVFLRRLEKNMLGKLKLRGIEDVKKVRRCEEPTTTARSESTS